MQGVIRNKIQINENGAKHTYIYILLEERLMFRNIKFG